MQAQDKHNKLKNVIIPFGIYKGQRILDISNFEDSKCRPVGKQYLRWVLKKMDIKNKLIKEAMEFYGIYLFMPGNENSIESYLV